MIMARKRTKISRTYLKFQVSVGVEEKLCNTESLMSLAQQVGERWRKSFIENKLLGNQYTQNLHSSGNFTLEESIYSHQNIKNSTFIGKS